MLRQFSPAFLGRLVLVPYYPLGDWQIRNIVDLKLEKLAQRFAENHNARFTWDDEVSELVTARCTEVDSGARNIDFILTQTVLPQISSLVLERISMLQPFSAIRMRVGADQQFAYDFQDSALGGQA